MQCGFESVHCDLAECYAVILLTHLHYAKKLVTSYALVATAHLNTPQLLLGKLPDNLYNRRASTAEFHDQNFSLHIHGGPH